MKVLDLDGKERDVKYVKKIIHDTYDMNGKKIQTEMVEVVIIGKLREWTTWYEHNDFRELNSDVEIEDDHLMIDEIEEDEIEGTV